MPNVYIPNKSFHSFDGARKYGELVFLTEGRLNQYKVTTIMHQMATKMAASQPDDWLLISSLPMLAALAASVLAAKHQRVNYLIYNGDTYETRTVNLTFNDLKAYTQLIG